MLRSSVLYDASFICIIWIISNNLFEYSFFFILTCSKQWLKNFNHEDAENATPKAVLTGHKSAVTCVIVSAELGIVVSASKGKLMFCVNQETCCLLVRVLF